MSARTKLGRVPFRIESFFGAAALPLHPHDTGITVIRPEDLLVLTFDRVNLRLETEGGVAKLVKAGEGPAYLVVRFQPQHILERAYFQSALNAALPVSVALEKHGGLLDVTKASASQIAAAKLKDPDVGSDSLADDPEEPPIPSVIAGLSRLVFRVPDEVLPLTFTLPELLARMKELELSVPVNALPATSSGRGGFRLAPSSLLLAAVAAEELTSVRVGAVATIGRAHRKARTVGNALGVSLTTGSATRGSAIAIPATQLDDIVDLLERYAPIPYEPSAHETAIEVPHRLIVSPSRRGAWFHSPAAVTRQETGKTELWHTRLGARPADAQAAIEGKHAQNVLRAVWTWDPEPVVPSDPEGFVDVPEHVHDPWRASLDSFDRHNAVHLTSDFRLRVKKRPFEPQPLDVDLFMLTALGAWMDTRGEWDVLPAGLSVEEWRHRATLGRDHYVRVVYAGYLFPFGHRASVIKITERKFHAVASGRRAYLRQRMFIVPRERVKAFRNTTRRTQGKPTGAENDLSIDLMMPFEAIRITTLASPDLDPPESEGQDTTPEDIDGRKQSCFWPHVGGKPFRFHLVATDIEGNTADFTAPLVFVGKEVADANLGSPENSIIEEIRTRYETDDGGQRATVPLGGQKVAFAESDTPDDTALETVSLTFGAEIPVSSYNTLDRFQPRFYPVVRTAAVNVPSMQKIAQTSEPSNLVYAARYLEQSPGSEFGAANPGQVFLAADPASPKTEVAFSKKGDRGGGLATPDLGLSGLSRLSGPVSGDLETVADGDFEPGAFFKGLDAAKLFGAISLTDIIDFSPIDDLARVPRFTGQTLNQVEQLLADLEQLRIDLHETDLSNHAVVASIGGFAIAVGTLPPNADVTPALGKIPGLLNDLSGLSAALDALQPGSRAVVERRIAAVTAGLGALNADLLGGHVAGDVLPEAVNARFEWRPRLKALDLIKPLGGTDERSLVISVEAADTADGPGEPAFTVTASFDAFLLDLTALKVGFERLQFRVRDGKKPEIDVLLKQPGGIAFGPPLEFVDTLRSLIPGDGFADPPAVEVGPEGITAGYSVGLPNIAVGVFSLENLSLSAGFALPFVGPPMSVWFRFCERENPALLTVSLFGGGGFFGITTNADGLHILEASFEFGAAISIDFGVASGSVSAMAGIYFKIEAGDASLTGYFRMRGEVEALGVVTVSIELYLDLTYEFATNKCVGTATITVEVDVTLFSVSVEITATKKFAGSGADPTLAELLDVAPDATSDDWEAYCAAFA